MKPLVLSLPLLSMPTPQEIAAAEPLVQEVMKAETEALRRGKKTRKQVGDAAVALAKEAQAPAEKEKYILLTGAFDYYMRGGAYDKASTSLASLRTAIPDCAVAAKNAKDAKNSTTKYTKYTKREDDSRVEHVERVEGQSGIICSR